jgi:hypothetical protein
MKKIIADSMREFKRNLACRPRVFGVYDGHVKNVRVDQWMSHDDRELGRLTIEKLMIALVKDGANAVALVSETWVVMSAERSVLEASFEGRLYKHPDRREMLTVMYNMPGRNIGATALILRKPDRIGRWEFYSSTTAEDIIGHEMRDIAGVRFGNIFFKATGRVTP